MTSRPTYLSLFTGIGGLDLAVEAMGFECVGQVEREPACLAVLERHWPGVPRWSDVRELTAASYAEVSGGRVDSGASPRAGASGLPGDDLGQGREPNVGNQASDRGPDLIAGGFPCQPVSTAGQRKAQDDDRWLWPEFARIVRDLEPRWVVVENVSGLRSAGEPRGSAFAEVLRDLAALGFDAQWGSVRASDAGACHRRERIFLVAENATRNSGIKFEKRLQTAVPTDSKHRRQAGSDPDDGERQAVQPVTEHGEPDAPDSTSQRSQRGQHGDGGSDLRTVVADTSSTGRGREGHTGGGGGVRLMQGHSMGLPEHLRQIQEDG